MCQCPIGLRHHFYEMEEEKLRKFFTCVNALSGSVIISTEYKEVNDLYNIHPCQCPIGLSHHFYLIVDDSDKPTEKECQCPIGLSHHFYKKGEKL